MGARKRLLAPRKSVCPVDLGTLVVPGCGRVFPCSPVRARAAGRVDPAPGISCSGRGPGGRSSAPGLSACLMFSSLDADLCSPGLVRCVNITLRMHAHHVHGAGLSSGSTASRRPPLPGEDLPGRRQSSLRLQRLRPAKQQAPQQVGTLASRSWQNSLELGHLLA